MQTAVQPIHKSSRSKRTHNHRKGAIVVLAAALMLVLVGMLAFSIDAGYMLTLRTEAQRAADSGALAGAGSLADGTIIAEQQARQYTQRNNVGSRSVPNSSIQVQFGQWNSQARTFLPTLEEPTAVRVFARRDNQPLFFAGIFGKKNFGVGAEAIATYGPRDIMVVLDYSASMNDDSEFSHMSRLGRSQIEGNLLEIYRDLGTPTFGKLGWKPVSVGGSSNAAIKQQLGLDKVRYPYPSGSWDGYIDYVQSSSVIAGAGYGNKFGYMTLVNYWLEQQPRADQTPDLWQTSEQPITALKDAFAVFLGFMQQGKTADQVGLAVYTAADGTATLESGLTRKFQTIEAISRQRQAGHYDEFTNIGAGMRTARLELEKNGRSGALKMIVLMTDGIANRPSNTTVAKKFVLDEARLAAKDKFPVVTISLGAAADKQLMQQVADMTSGVHFNIPGGQGVSQYEKALKDVFQQIADDRPLKLVK